MDDHVGIIRSKIESIEESLGAMRYDSKEQARALQEIAVTLAKQEENLKEHMRRSDLNERAVDLLSKQFAPVRAHVEQMRGAGKLISGLALLASIAAAIALFK